MNSQDNLRGTVVVTGVSTGIGRAIAEDLIKAGYRVFGSVRKLADAQALVSGFGARFTPLVFDVTDDTALPAAAETVRRALNGATLTALVNNAGISLNGPLLHQPIEEFRKTFDVNLFGLLQVTKAFLPLLGAGRRPVRHPGRVINIGSVSGAMTTPFMGAYSASKHAVEALGQALRRELMPYGIEVSTIEPGFIRSQIFEKTAALLQERSYGGTHYAEMWQQFNRSLLANEEKAASPQKVTKAVLHAIASDRPRSRYPLDPAWYAARWLPDRVFDKLVMRALGIDKMIRSAARTDV
jgi:NAD(P)-dependent dehydrogenase (short-subunit alcohol dehydrogenase family)